MTMEELKLQLEQLTDPSVGKTLKETYGIKHIGYDDDRDLVILIVAMGKIGGDEEKALRRAIAKVVKIDNGFTGIRLQIDEAKILNSITKKNVKFIGIISGKGGVGKSNVAANIAYRFVKKGIKVGLIDADIYGSSLPTILEMPHQSPKYTDDSKIIPIEKDGIEVISTEFFTDSGQPVMWRGGMLNSMLSHFFYDIKWHDDTEYVIIDFPPGTGDILLDVKNIVPQTKMIIVTTPNVSASHVAVKAGIAAATLGHEILGVVENMSYYLDPHNKEKTYIFGKGGGTVVANELDTEVIAELPINQPKFHQDLYEIEEENGKIFDDIADYIIFKTNE